MISREEPSSRRYWLLLVFATLMLLPAPMAIAGLAAVAIGAMGSAAVSRVRSVGGRPVVTAQDATLLGTDSDGATVVLRDSQLSAHGLIVGASGAGKSTTLLALLTNNVRRGLPVVAIDMKGSPEFARRLAAAAASAGTPFRMWTPDGPSQWNPLRHGNATELKDKLIATERFTEPHYQRAAERYAQIALQVLGWARGDRAPTLADVVEAMEPARLASLLRGLPRERTERVHDYLATLTADQLSAVRGLGTRLAVLSESQAGRFLGASASGPAAAGPAIDLRDALEGRQVVLFSLNSSTYGSAAAQLGTLAVQDLVAATGHRLAREQGGAQAIVGIDEFSALRSENVISLLARGREAGVSVFLATQELADLDRAAPGLRDQVLGNTAVKIAHRQDVPASASTVAQMAGTVKRWEETRQYGGRLLGRRETGRGTRREVEEFVVHPNEIKALRTGEAVMIVKQPRTRVRTVRVTRPERDGPVHD